MSDKILAVHGISDKILAVHSVPDKILSVGVPICSACGGLYTPTQIQVTFAGITPCPMACYFRGSDPCGWTKTQDFSSLNDTYILSRNTISFPGDCRWSCVREKALTSTWFTEITCTNPCEGAILDVCVVVDANYGTIEMGWGVGEDYYPVLFTGTLTPDSGYCLKQTDIVNEHICSEDPFNAYGGTATIVEL